MSDTTSTPVAMPRDRALIELTPAERRALTLCKWTYTLRAAGFSVAEAQRIQFCRRLADLGRISS